MEMKSIHHFILLRIHMVSLLIDLMASASVSTFDRRLSRVSKLVTIKLVKTVILKMQISSLGAHSLWQCSMETHCFCMLKGKSLYQILPLLSSRMPGLVDSQMASHLDGTCHMSQVSQPPSRSGPHYIRSICLALQCTSYSLVSFRLTTKAPCQWQSISVMSI